MSSSSESFHAFLEREGVSLDKPSDLIGRALTHSSYAFENELKFDNERLEFLGDAVIGLLVSEVLFERSRVATEGTLSKARASLVNRKALGRVGRDLGLGRHVRLGRGEEQSGGRERLSTLGCVLESLVGAFFRERGLDFCRRFVEEFVVPNDEDWSAVGGLADFDAKSRLQELLQKNGDELPRYELTGEGGPDHQKTFKVAVYIGERLLGNGEGPRKKTAENAAAAAALEALGAAGEG